MSTQIQHQTDSIHPATLDFLLSPAGRAAAAALVDEDLSDAHSLALLTHLRRYHRPEEAGALLALARLRRRAAAKFPAAAHLFFTAEALEQATAAPIAVHRAAYLDQLAPPGPLLDLGCGIGGDLLALARLRPVIAYDLDPVRLRLAQANVEALSLAHRVEFRLADWTVDLAAGRLPAASAAFADPARRAEGKRIFSLHRLQPPLAALLRLHAAIPTLGVKVMPGVQDAELPAACGVEFISHAGVCKEAVLWFGPAARHPRWASVYADEAWYTLVASGAPPPLGPLVPGMTLYEPDPAVIRAGPFAELCALLDAHLFDPQIAYLAGNARHTSPFAQPFAVEEIHPFSLRTLNQRLHALGIGAVELKKRGVPFAPEELRPQLHLVPGGRPAVIFFTRRGAQRIMLIAARPGA